MRDETIHPDPVGFPMIWVQELGLYVHCLPVTKVQFEYFLSDARDGHFDPAWYESIRQLNPRISPRRIWSRNYWNAFLTGILPGEAERYAAWNGDGYHLLDSSEWQSFFRAVRGKSPSLLDDLGISERLGPRPRELFQTIGRAVDDVWEETREVGRDSPEKIGLAERLLLRLGVMEWVSLRNGQGLRWGGLGEPHPNFCGNLFAPECGEVVLPGDPERQRLAPFGFRLAFDPR